LSSWGRSSIFEHQSFFKEENIGVIKVSLIDIWEIEK
jgi:hypothetical protein